MMMYPFIFEPKFNLFIMVISQLCFTESGAYSRCHTGAIQFLFQSVWLIAVYVKVLAD